MEDVPSNPGLVLSELHIANFYIDDSKEVAMG